MADLNSNNYFKGLDRLLKSRGRAVPTVLIDLDILDENIAVLQNAIHPNADLRLVVKSLPAPGLLDYIMEKTGASKLMVFHEPFLSELVREGGSDLDILLGKPMPVSTVQYFYDHLTTELTFDADQQIQWLCDTTERVQQYIDLARSIDRRLRLNLEIDVGLHRGGFATLDDLKDALALIEKNKEAVEFAGLMGYDPHVSKIPSILRSRSKSLAQANGFYKSCKDLIQSDFPKLWNEHLTWNGAGSPTVALHSDSTPLNDISAGSCLLKPTTFDIDTLTDYEPSAFIAAPVLKRFQSTTIPGLERFKSILNLFDKSNRQSFFIYGGYWKADYYYPIGVKANGLFGPSTNQSMINAPAHVELSVDDFVFLRPQQSEYVLLHFGDILAVREGRVVDEWEVFLNR